MDGPAENSTCLNLFLVACLCLLVFAVPRKSCSRDQPLPKPPTEPFQPDPSLLRSQTSGNFTGEGYDQRGIHVVGGNKLLVCQIQSVASIVMTQMEARMDGEPIWHSGELVELEGYNIRKDEEMKVLQMTEENRPPSVVMVRNPVTRILAAYISKIDTEQEFDFCWDSSCPKEIGSFAKLIKALKHAHMALVDKHFVPQYMECGFDEGLTYDCIVSYENRTKEWRQCLTELGLWGEYGVTGWGSAGTQSFFEGSEKLGNNNVKEPLSVTDERHLIQSYYTHDLLKAVFEIYRRDFELFGYSMDTSHYLDKHVAVKPLYLKRTSPIA